MKYASDAAIISKIREGGKLENDALSQLYTSNWPVLRAKLMQWGAPLDDATDVFQVGVTELYHIIKHSDRFRGDSKLSTFLVSICRNLWLKELRKRKVAEKHLSAFQAEQDAVELPEDLGNFVEKQERVQAALTRLDDNCRELLVQFYYFKQSMEIICDQLGLKNANVAKSQKWRCKEKLRKLLKR